MQVRKAVFPVAGLGTRFLKHLSRTQPGALCRALDEPGDIRDHETLIGIRTNDAEIGIKRGERVIGDLRMGAGQLPDQTGFTSIRQTQQPHVG